VRAVNRALDGILVTLVLIVSTGYAVLALGPKGLRKWLWAALAERAEKAPAGLGLERLARRLRAAADKTAGACGGCDSCGPEPEVSAGGTREVRVPLAKIGKRRR
jgi:hypothetical protein